MLILAYHDSFRIPVSEHAHQCTVGRFQSPILEGGIWERDQYTIVQVGEACGRDHCRCALFRVHLPTVYCTSLLCFDCLGSSSSASGLVSYFKALPLYLIVYSTIINQRTHTVFAIKVIFVTNQYLPPCQNSNCVVYV